MQFLSKLFLGQTACPSFFSELSPEKLTDMVVVFGHSLDPPGQNSKPLSDEEGSSGRLGSDS